MEALKNEDKKGPTCRDQAVEKTLHPPGRIRKLRVCVGEVWKVKMV
jgi:hypothetical protein